jgi:hypothetical protein
MKGIWQKIKGADKTRTINLALFLGLLIALPLVLSAPQNQQTLKQNAQVPSQNAFPIYGVAANVLDGLVNGWTAYTTFGTPTAYDDSNTSPVYQGTHSIKYTVTAPFDGFVLTAPQPFNISNFNYLTFYAQAGIAGQRFNIHLIGVDGKPLPLPVEVSMDQYGGVPTVGTWTVYNVPISAFGIVDKTILGISFQDANGGTQNIQPPPPIYFDEISFTKDTGQNPVATPINTGAPSAGTATPFPTPEAPYYPNINPWIFIIPGIIVLIAIIFQ